MKAPLEDLRNGLFGRLLGGLWPRLIPAWLRHYPRAHLGSDLLAGLLTAVLVLPQNLAYALLAGLPPQAGLLASVWPVLAYALWGSSQTQAVGPVAVTSIITLSVLSPLAAPYSAAYVALAAGLALGSGALLLVFGALRLGFLSNLLSRPVVSGFISGSAVLILASQLKALLGLSVASAPHAPFWQGAWATLQALPHSQPATSAIGLSSLLLLAFSRHALGGWLRRAGLAPARADMVVRLMPLAAVLATTGAVMAWNLDQQHGVAVVGHVAASGVGFQWFWPSSAQMSQLALPALILAFMGMVQNIGMGQALAVKRREKLDANQELRGLGAANVVAGFYGGMPVGGGISRTAVNLAAGAQTPLAGVAAALVMGLILLLDIHSLGRMPQAVLAASIMVAAFSMVDGAALRRAWAYDRADALALAGTALGVIMLGLQGGIALGIGLSLASLIYHASAPHIAVLGRIVGTEHFRNAERYGVESLPHVLLFRVDESLFFGNLQAVEARLNTELQQAPQVRDLVLVMSAVNRVDMTALDALVELNQDLRLRGIRLHLAEVKGPVQDRLRQSALWPALSGQVFLSTNDAFEQLQSEQLRHDQHQAEQPPGEAGPGGAVPSA